MNNQAVGIDSTSMRTKATKFGLLLLLVAIGLAFLSPVANSFVRPSSVNGPTATKTFALTVTTPPTCNPVSFAAATFEIGDKVGAVLVGDFNGDGRQDLAVTAIATNWSTRTLILLGDGAGHFTSFSEAPLGARAIADINGDGKQDLVGLDSSNAVIYLGDGAGHFNAANSVDTGCTAPFQVAVGDFNGDGRLDLATACYFTNSVTILLGDGAGNFGAPASFSVSGGPQGLAVGDFNGDGKQDLAVACLPAGAASILLGDGAGSFAAATNFNAGATPRDIEVGDFNGDGKQDLAVSNPSANAALIMLGNGAGGFGAPASFAVGSDPETVIAVGDFNGDGKQDLAVPNFGSSNLSLLLGDGAGAFGSALNFGVGLSPFGVAVGDFNGDGKQDLATANWDSNNVSILLGSCIAPTAIVVSSSLNSSNVGQLVIFTANVTSSSGTPTGTVEFFDNEQSLGTANLSTASATLTTSALVAGSHSITVSYSGDATHLPSTSAVIIQTVNKLATHTSLASFPNPTVFGQAVTFTANVTSGTGTPTGSVEFFDYAHSLGVVSFSAGIASLTTAGLSAGSHSITAVYNGNANFLSSTSPVLVQTVAAVTPVGSNINLTETAGPTTVGITFTDVNVPGTTTITPLDPATAGTIPGGFSVGNIAFDLDTTSTFVGSVNVCFQVPTVTDPVAFSKLRILHSAPKFDLATANYNSNNASVVLGNGAGSFSSATNFAAGSTPLAIAVGDFNGDGKPDLAVGSNLGHTISILLGDGSGGFGPAASTSLVVGSTVALAVGDFNSDGKADLAYLDSNSGINYVTVLLGNGLGGFGPATNYPVGTVHPNPISLALGDFNRDGKVDLVVASDFPGKVSIFLGNGAGSFSSGTNLSLAGRLGAVAVGDFNRDGKLDLAVSAVAGVTQDTVTILLGNGSGGFAAAGSFGSTQAGLNGPYSIAVGDFNNDGKLDLAAANSGSNGAPSVSIAVGNGGGGFGPFTQFAMPGRYVVAADFNNDGNLDIATQAISVRLGLGNGSFGAGTNYSVGARPEGIAVGNFNRDAVVVDQTILSGPNAPNFATKTICARTFSFSPFILASVVDVTPPTISNVSADPSVIWPPDHNMVDITVNYEVLDDFASAAEIISSLEVSSNEPVNTTGDGNTEPDIEIIDAHHLRLRAERSGSGNGRVYTITITCMDSAQNTSKRTVTVVVPRSQD